MHFTGVRLLHYSRFRVTDHHTNKPLICVSLKCRQDLCFLLYLFFCDLKPNTNPPADGFQLIPLM